MLLCFHAHPILLYAFIFSSSHFESFHHFKSFSGATISAQTTRSCMNYVRSSLMWQWWLWQPQLLPECRKTSSTSWTWVDPKCMSSLSASGLDLKRVCACVRVFLLLAGSKSKTVTEHFSSNVFSGLRWASTEQTWSTQCCPRNPKRWMRTAPAGSRSTTHVNNSVLSLIPVHAIFRTLS